MTHLPNDADGDALRRLLNDGSDLTKPMVVDFQIAVPDEASCQAVAKAAGHVGFHTKVVAEKNGEWTCWCTKTMVPSYDEVIAVQKLLDELSCPYGGWTDGWGSFGNKPK
jgi:hypothetical protein